jgi:hypothetical protein
MRRHHEKKGAANPLPLVLFAVVNAASNPQAALRPLSSKAFNPALHGDLIAVRNVHHPDHYQSIERRVVSVWMLFEIGPHAGDRVRKVACVNVSERSSFAPSEMLVPRQCVPIVFPTPRECRGRPSSGLIMPRRFTRRTARPLSTVHAAARRAHVELHRLAGCDGCEAVASA